MAAFRVRLQEFEETLNAEVIDMKKFQRLCFNGCPYEQSYRSTCWKLLLNYFPKERSKWKQVQEKQRSCSSGGQGWWNGRSNKKWEICNGEQWKKSYAQFIDEMIIKPGSKASEDGVICDVTFEDHPLNPNPDSKWAAYFRDNEMLVQIDKDCRRLCPDLNFFQKATEFPSEDLVCGNNKVDTLRKRVEQCVLRSETVATNRLGIYNMRTSRQRSNSEGYATLAEGQEAHWEVCERILFIYAKLNPGLGYVQGMNEILGPIYYVFASDPSRELREHAEADSFFCFTTLMSEIRDNFIKTLDDSQCGIGYLMASMMNMLEEKDATLCHKLVEQDLKPQYYAFRWLTLLFSQEFPLPDVLRIWDSLFSDENRFSFLICVACAMLILLRDDLIQGDFPSNMKLVQNFPHSIVDVQTVIKKAVELAR